MERNETKTSSTSQSGESYSSWDASDPIVQRKTLFQRGQIDGQKVFRTLKTLSPRQAEIERQKLHNLLHEANKPKDKIIASTPFVKNHKDGGDCVPISESTYSICLSPISAKEDSAKSAIAAVEADKEKKGAAHVDDDNNHSDSDHNELNCLSYLDKENNANGEEIQKKIAEDPPKLSVKSKIPLRKKLKRNTSKKNTSKKKQTKSIDQEDKNKTNNESLPSLILCDTPSDINQMENGPEIVEATSPKQANDIQNIDSEKHNQKSEANKSNKTVDKAEPNNNNKTVATNTSDNEKQNEDNEDRQAENLRQEKEQSNVFNSTNPTNKVHSIGVNTSPDEPPLKEKTINEMSNANNSKNYAKKALSVRINTTPDEVLKQTTSKKTLNFVDSTKITREVQSIGVNTTPENDNTDFLDKIPDPVEGESLRQYELRVLPPSLLPNYEIYMPKNANSRKSHYPPPSRPSRITNRMSRYCDAAVSPITVLPGRKKSPKIRNTVLQNNLMRSYAPYRPKSSVYTLRKSASFKDSSSNAEYNFDKSNQKIIRKRKTAINIDLHEEDTSKHLLTSGYMEGSQRRSSKEADKSSNRKNESRIHDSNEECDIDDILDEVLKPQKKAPNNRKSSTRKKSPCGVIIESNSFNKTSERSWNEICSTSKINSTNTKRKLLDEADLQINVIDEVIIPARCYESEEVVEPLTSTLSFSAAVLKRKRDRMEAGNSSSELSKRMKSIEPVRESSSIFAIDDVNEVPVNTKPATLDKQRLKQKDKSLSKVSKSLFKNVTSNETEATSVRIENSHESPVNDKAPKKTRTTRRTTTAKRLNKKPNKKTNSSSKKREEILYIRGGNNKLIESNISILSSTINNFILPLVGVTLTSEIEEPQVGLRRSGRERRQRRLPIVVERKSNSKHGSKQFLMFSEPTIIQNSRRLSLQKRKSPKPKKNSKKAKETTKTVNSKKSSSKTAQGNNTEEKNDSASIHYSPTVTLTNMKSKAKSSKNKKSTSKKNKEKSNKDSPTLSDTRETVFSLKSPIIEVPEFEIEQNEEVRTKIDVQLTQEKSSGYESEKNSLENNCSDYIVQNGEFYRWKCNENILISEDLIPSNIFPFKSGEIYIKPNSVKQNQLLRNTNLFFRVNSGKASIKIDGCIPFQREMGTKFLIPAGHSYSMTNMSKTHCLAMTYFKVVKL